MFTGLIQAVGKVTGASQTAAGRRLLVDLGQSGDDVKSSDSVAISGVCLTVAAIENTTAAFDVSGETLSKSTLGTLRPGSMVNVELALRATDRIGGHFVQGHVDGMATVQTTVRQGRFVDMAFTAEPGLLENMVVKGSVAVDGVSLTVADVNERGFRAALIPETLEKTTLARAKVGDKVNIETDIIGKMMKRQLDRILPAEPKLTVEKLEELGFGR